jgi:hypothetical protein
MLNIATETQKWILLTLLSGYKIFRTDHKRILVVLYSDRYLCSSLTKFGFLDRYFIKVPKIRFQENPSSGSQVDTDGQTDGRTDMTKLTDAFCDLSESA